MRVKKFHASSINEAAELMKKEFGENAVILHTKKGKKSGLFGLFGKPFYEIIGAIDENNDIPAKSTIKQASKPNLVMNNSSRSNDWSSAVQKIYQQLQSRGVPHTASLDLIKAVLRQVPKKDYDNYEVLSKQLSETISSYIKVQEPWEFTQQTKVVTLIGPTGVGKTTTVAKLAANFHLIANKDVGLITLDTYRIAAVDQLKTYADIINVPLRVAYNANELQSYLREMGEKDLVLIDTAGRSHLNKKALTELQTVLEAVNSEVDLVVSATTKSEDLAAIVDAYQSLNFDNIILTKIDETNDFGVIFQAATYAKVPIAFLTTGQSVPDDIEVAEVHNLTKMVMGG